MKTTIEMTPEELRKIESDQYERGRNKGFWEGIQAIYSIQNGGQEPQFYGMDAWRYKLWRAVVDKVKGVISC